jgi:hypothetical protein
LSTFVLGTNEGGKQRCAKGVGQASGGLQQAKQVKPTEISKRILDCIEIVLVKIKLYSFTMEYCTVWDFQQLFI